MELPVPGGLVGVFAALLCGGKAWVTGFSGSQKCQNRKIVAVGKHVFPKLAWKACVIGQLFSPVRQSGFSCS